jgi:agmatinase
MNARLSPVPPERPTFLGMPRCTDLDTLEADIAILGVPFGGHYDMLAARETASDAPQKIREQSMRFVEFLHHYDYDFGGDIFAGRDITIVDCGDVAMEAGDYAGNNARTTEIVRKIIDRGTVPISIGGSHAISIPVMRAFEGLDPMFVVQIDAHIDFRNEIDGNREGWSSPMRRAAESEWVSGIAQIGLRSIGSARQQEVDDALAYGSVMIPALELHTQGVEAALARIPDQELYYITLDTDGLDPVIAPAVGLPAFGGVTYYEATDIISGIARKGRVVGFDFPVVSPILDIQDRTSRLAARLLLNFIGALAHTGQIGRE